jgi:polysaccharide export outer membrane protein
MFARAGKVVLTWILCAAASVAAQVPPAPEQARPPETDAADPAGWEFWSSGRYRLTPSDVIELAFPRVPEFDQILTVQPDGYVSLKVVGDVRVQGRTLPEFRLQVLEAYEGILREPLVSITLKEFEKPYFVATGEVKTPGKFELRGATTVTQGLALAGGMTAVAKHSQVILFRRYTNDLVEVKEIDVKKMLASRDLSEDYLLRPGDTLYIPQSFLSKLKPFLPTAGLGVYLNPFR